MKILCTEKLQCFTYNVDAHLTYKTEIRQNEKSDAQDFEIINFSDSEPLA